VASSAAAEEAAYASLPLDAVKAGTKTTENALLVQLKARYTIRRITIRAHEAHGRFVKRINVWYHVRAVASLAELKMPENVAKWRRAASVVVPRERSVAQIDLPLPLVAANLMFEFAEFHADPASAAGGGGSGGGSKAGATLHCPRCGRPVTDMHGVCRQCGEVAFQCRQCRHINYESLDAFLCAECGYCAYAQFSYRLTAFKTAGATAVTSEAELAAATALLADANAAVQSLREEVEDLRP
ncbi:unnamed protein product, partial [Phaeothamnion confervicola]